MTLGSRRTVQSRPRFHAPTLPTTNLFARFIAGVGETVVGGFTTVWADQSGGGWDATPTGAIPPYSSTDHRGRPVVRLSFANDAGLKFASAHSFNARNFSVFMATRQYPLQGTSRVVIGLENYTASSHMWWSGSYPFDMAVVALHPSPKIKPPMNPMVMGMTSGTTSAIYTQYQSATLAGVTADTDCAGAVIGAHLGSVYTDMDLYEVLVYEGVPTSSEVTAIINYLTNTYQIRTTDYPKNVVFQGDSITFGFGPPEQAQSYPFQVLRRGVDDWRMLNIGTFNSTTLIVSTQGAATDTLLEPSYKRNVLMLCIGHNDLKTRDPATTYATLVSYVQARVAAGWEVWVATCIATVDGAGLTQANIVDYNARIRGDTGAGIISDAGANRVVEFGRLPQFADSAAVSNTTYYQSDKVHPTAAGAKVLADTVAPLLGAY